jgi:hypothetical protein
MMSDDVQMALICFGPLILFAILGIAYFCMAGLASCRRHEEGYRGAEGDLSQHA